MCAHGGDDTTVDGFGLSVVRRLESADGARQSVRIVPRLGCEDLASVRGAALGIAILPDHVCRDALQAGTPLRVLTEWRGLPGIIHLAFTTPRGLPPAVRALIDHLAAGFPRDGLA